MGIKRLLFRVLYRVGFTPWDGHPLARGLRELIEGGSRQGAPGLSPGAALDVGCGTGDNSIYLAQHGWRVTGVDFTPRALRKARVKAVAAGVSVDFVSADATRLAAAGVGSGFSLVVDSGCLHGMSDHDRAAYAREVTAVTALDARLLIVAFTPGALFGVRGIEQTEVERLFAPGWALLSAGFEPASLKTNGDQPVRNYLLARRS